jgi:DNA topoisomerase-1
MRVITGRCTAAFDGPGSRERRQHGDCVVLVKPDDTVLVHDARGYQPVAWLTRPDAVTITDEAVVAQDGDQHLRVTRHDTAAREVSASAAGVPVGDCPDCGDRLVRARGDVSCPGCGARYGLPAGATVLEETCGCGCPRLRVARGGEFEVCLDRDCESLDGRVREHFDRAFDCPACGGDLRVLRRGGLIFGCEGYPDCETSFAVPQGVHAGPCECGLPAFETGSGRRCLDSTCGVPAE